MICRTVDSTLSFQLIDWFLTYKIYLNNAVFFGSSENLLIIITENTDKFFGLIENLGKFSDQYIIAIFWAFSVKLKEKY